MEYSPSMHGTGRVGADCFQTARQPLCDALRLSCRLTRRLRYVAGRSRRINEGTWSARETVLRSHAA